MPLRRPASRTLGVLPHTMSADDSSANGGRDSGLRRPLLGGTESNHGSTARKAVPAPVTSAEQPGSTHHPDRGQGDTEEAGRASSVRSVDSACARTPQPPPQAGQPAGCRRMSCCRRISCSGRMACSRCRKCPSVSLSSPKGVVLTAMALLFPLLGPVLYVTMSVNIIEAPKGIVPQGASRGSDQLACVQFRAVWAGPC